MRSVFDTPGTKPGTDKAVKLHQAAAQGYTVGADPSRVKDGPRGSKTGRTHVPGWTHRK
jgi:hypothetical protein